MDERGITVLSSPTGVACAQGGQHLTNHPTCVVAVRSLNRIYESFSLPAKVLKKDTGISFFREYSLLPLIEEIRIAKMSDTCIRFNMCLVSSTVLVLDTVGFSFFFNKQYREFFVDEQQYRIPALGHYRQSIFTVYEDFSLVGARFAEDTVVSDISLSIRESVYPLFCFGESPMNQNQDCLLGFSSQPGQRIVLDPGKELIFSFDLCVYNDRRTLDREIESLRKKKYSIDSQEKVRCQRNVVRRDPSFAFLNVPWRSQGKKGIRAGSRWPHLRDQSEGDYLPFPFFLAYATALLKREGFQAICIDAIADDQHEGLFFERVFRFSPDVVVIETAVASFYNDMEIAQKFSVEGIYTILCGPVSWMYQAAFLEEHSFIDCVCVGEYEFTVLDIARAWQKGAPLSTVAGIVYRDGAQVIKTADRQLGDLALLPWPERDSLPMQRYQDTPGKILMPSVQMISSRGCTFRCNFCLWPQVMFENAYRVRPVRDCIDEMQYLVDKKNFKSVYWDDDTFNIDPRRTEIFAQMIIERGLQSVPWAMMARADLMTPSLLEILRKAGMAAVKYGVENTSVCAQKECGKYLNIQTMRETVRCTKQLGIKVHLTFVFGFDTDTEEGIKRTIDEALSFNPDSIQFSVLTPFPGTRLYEQLTKEQRIIQDEWSYYDGHHGCVFKPAAIDPDRLIALKEYAWRRWVDHQRSQRGFWGDCERFMNYVRSRGFHYAVRKSREYLKYLFFYRKTVISDNLSGHSQRR